MADIIREATLADATALHRLNLEGLGYDFPLERTRARLASVLAKGRDKLFVAERAGLVLGYVHAADYDCLYFDSLKNVLALVVEPTAQHSGLGRALMQAVEHWAQAEGCAGVRLVSGFNRVEAHQCYLRLGYTDRKDQKNFMKLF